MAVVVVNEIPQGDQSFYDEVSARVREACRAMPDPGPLAIFDNVYAEPNQQLQAERDGYAAYLDTFADEPGAAR